MNSKTKEILHSFILIAIFNFLWVFIHSYINNYLIFQPVDSGGDIPKSFFLWNSYIDLIVRVGKYGIINTISMFVGIVIIINHKNSDYIFQIIITALLFILNLILSIIFLPLFRKAGIEMSILNMLLYTVYYIVPWLLYLLFFNKYYVRGLGHLLKYFFIGLFIFIIFFIARNNSIISKEIQWKNKQNIKKKEELAQSSEDTNVNTPKTDIKKAPKGFTGIKQRYPDIHIYPFKSGIIIYTIDGEEKGEETVSFDHYGLRELTMTETYRDTFKIKKMLLLDNKYVYAIDLNHNIGNIAKSEMTKNMNENSRYTDILDVKMKNLKLHKSGRKYFKGKACEVWTSNNGNTTVWTWKGLILKKVIYKNNLPVSTLSAKEIKTNVNIPQEKFFIPPGITFIRYYK